MNFFFWRRPRLTLSQRFREWLMTQSSMLDMNYIAQDACPFARFLRESEGLPKARVSVHEYAPTGRNRWLPIPQDVQDTLYYALNHANYPTYADVQRGAVKFIN